MKKNIFKKLKSEKGITMIVLSAAIIILAIITSMLTYFSTDAIDIKSLNNMYNDIELLEEKVSMYYYKNNRIPVLIEYDNVEAIIGTQKSNMDNNKYYVIDIEKLENITLSYGKQYQTIKSNYTNTGFNVKEYTDLYVMNEQSHNIYYIKGIKVEGKTYNTRPKESENAVEMKATKISSIEDLIRFQQNVAKGKTYQNEYVVMTKNLDFENANSYDGTQVTIGTTNYTYGGENDLKAYLSETGTGWTPIGNATNSFLGIFDGQNYKITNMYASSDANKILFYGTPEGVKNVTAEWK